MAYSRMINTNFWKDSYVIDLDPTEKLLFIYLLTNPRTNIAGIYEVALREIAFDTGIDRDMVQKILDRFINDDKIMYKKGWVVMQNWLKHQAKNPKVLAGIQRILENDIPEWLIDDLMTTINGGQMDLLAQPMDRLSKPIALNLTKLNLTKPNSTANGRDENKTQKASKKEYAISMQRERESESHLVENNKREVGKGYETFASVGEVLKSGKLKKIKGDQ